MTRRFTLAALHRVAKSRPEGYVDDVLSHATVNGQSVVMEDADYDRLVDKYRSMGPGAQLKTLLARFGIHADPTCQCNQMAKQMDLWGPEECLRHVEEIVDVMESTAKKRRLPFLRTAGRILVRRAISKSRALISREHHYGLGRGSGCNLRRSDTGRA